MKDYLPKDRHQGAALVLYAVMIAMTKKTAIPLGLLVCAHLDGLRKGTFTSEHSCTHIALRLYLVEADSGRISPRQHPVTRSALPALRGEAAEKAQ